MTTVNYKELEDLLGELSTALMTTDLLYFVPIIIVYKVL